LLNTAFFGASGGVVPQALLFAAEEPNFAGSLGVGFDIWQNDGDIGKPFIRGAFISGGAIDDGHDEAAPTLPVTCFGGLRRKKAAPSSGHA
jgi:hypothetical protein